MRMTMDSIIINTDYDYYAKMSFISFFDTPGSSNMPFISSYDARRSLPTAGIGST